MKILEGLALSSVKFIFGPIYFYYDKQNEYNFYFTIFYSILGGMIGVVFFSYLSDLIFKIWDYIKHSFRKTFSNKNNTFSTPVADVDGKIIINYSYIETGKSKKKVFNPRNRRLVRIWSEWGILGIAFITPVLLSIPLGTIITTRLVHSKKKVFIYMFCSILFWSVLITSIFELYHVATFQDLGKQITK